MTLLAPIWLLAGVLAALGVLALHLIARQRPAPMDLPTARFVPDLPARAASRARRPTDLLLLLLRAAAMLLLGLAFAGPVLRPERSPLLRIVLLDRSSSVAQPDSAASIARANLRDGDVLVTFDTTASADDWSAGDSIPGARQAPGDVAAGLLVAMREARDASSRADSIELVLVSPVDAAAWSPAVLAIREQWPGSIRVELVEGVAPDTTNVAISLHAEPDDPIGATLALLGGTSTSGEDVRVTQDAPTTFDSAWARDSGGVIVHWPSVDSVDVAAQHNAGAVYTGSVVAVAPWMRRGVPEGRAIAWWVDGTPAASEVPLGSGCLREVGIGIPPVGDVALAFSTQRLVRAIARPCGAAAPLGPVSDSLVRQLAGTGGPVASMRIVRAGVTVSPATPWLLGAGILLLLIEWALRTRAGSP